MAGPADSWQALAAATQPSQRDKRGQDLRGPPPARSARMEVTMNPIYSTAQLLAGLTVSACVVLTYAAAIPAALATPRPQPPGYYKHPRSTPCSPAARPAGRSSSSPPRPPCSAPRWRCS